MSTLTEIVGAVRDRLNTIDAFDQNSLDAVRRPANYPAAIIMPPTIPDYGLAIAGGGGQFDLPVLIVVDVSEAESQHKLWPFLDWEGSSSIYLAFETLRDVGLGDVDVRVASVADPGLVEMPDGTAAYGVTVNLTVIAS